MTIHAVVQNVASVSVTSLALSVVERSIAEMIPWLMVMVMTVVADLAAGVRKSYKLGVRVSWSTAIRETMGKIVTYIAFVMAVCMIDVVATDGGTIFAKWACLTVVAIEGGSVLSNLLRPYGIIVTPKTILQFFLRKSPLKMSDEDSDELLKEEAIKQAREFENKKWNVKKSKSKKESNG